MIAIILFCFLSLICEGGPPTFFNNPKWALSYKSLRALLYNIPHYTVCDRGQIKHIRK